jgi:protein-disulfide isomerase
MRSLDPHAPRLVMPVSRRDHILGPPDAPTTLVEYGDYQCPYCGRAHLVMKALLQQLGHSLRYVFRHFPLVTIHEHAGLAAQAAEAAGAQGKFWEMHDMLFTHQDALDIAHVVRYAAEIGLDLEQLDADLASGKYAARVQEDFRSGVRSGVNGTPTFFINGIRYNGSHDLGSFLSVLTAAA